MGAAQDEDRQHQGQRAGGQDDDSDRGIGDDRILDPLVGDRLPLVAQSREAGWELNRVAQSTGRDDAELGRRCEPAGPTRLSRRRRPRSVGRIRRRPPAQ